jgi:hypothetical protein
MAGKRVKHPPGVSVSDGHPKCTQACCSYSTSAACKDSSLFHMMTSNCGANLYSFSDVQSIVRARSALEAFGRGDLRWWQALRLLREAVLLEKKIMSDAEAPASAAS